MDLGITDKVRPLIDKVRRMVEDEIAPLDAEFHAEVGKHPSGDRFQLDEPEFEADVFTVSEMTIEPRAYPTGTILAFNGTTEWALDSVALEEALWLPREDQLRELTGYRMLRFVWGDLYQWPHTRERLERALVRTAA